MRRRSSALLAMIRPGGAPKRCSSASAVEWKVEARTPSTPRPASRARSSPAALSVNVTATSSEAGNAPLATCQAMRRVIVVVLPVPAPARMHTGPRVASAAARCSAFRSPRIRSASNLAHRSEEAGRLPHARLATPCRIPRMGRHPFRTAGLVVAGVLALAVLGVVAVFLYLRSYAPLDASARGYAPGPGLGADVEPTFGSGGRPVFIPG